MKRINREKSESDLSKSKIPISSIKPNGTLKTPNLICGTWAYRSIPQLPPRSFFRSRLRFFAGRSWGNRSPTANSYSRGVVVVVARIVVTVVVSDGRRRWWDMDPLLLPPSHRSGEHRRRAVPGRRSTGTRADSFHRAETEIGLGTESTTVVEYFEYSIFNEDQGAMSTVKTTPYVGFRGLAEGGWHVWVKGSIFQFVTPYFLTLSIIYFFSIFL